MIKAVH